MKKIFTSTLFILFAVNLIAQCVLDMTVDVDGTGNIVTTNSSTGVEPSTYSWTVYNMDLEPVFLTGSNYSLEHVESAYEITYSPLSVASYLVCLNGTGLGNNSYCDSICDTLIYTQGMMDTQITNGIDGLNGKSKISVYPIPAEDMLYVVGDKITQETEIKVFDVLGNGYKIVSSINDRGVEINVSFLPTGVYFINVQNTNEVIRFVVE